MEQLVAAQDPEEVKRIAPWPKPSDLRGVRSEDIESMYGMPPFHFFCRCTAVSRMDDNNGPGSDGIIKIGETVEPESANLTSDQEESLKAWSVYTPPEQANKINQARWATMGERSAERHAWKHGEARAVSAEGYVQLARAVISNPDDILVFRHKLRNTAQIAFGKRGNGVTDWLIAIVDSELGQIMTLYGLDAKNPRTYLERIAVGREEGGWLEVRVSHEGDLAE
ncbi:MAG: hypothetical protein VB144_13005 [Clostridia bacterium]|nr:hypothetical protein [Clostridia bacterium]